MLLFISIADISDRRYPTPLDEDSQRLADHNAAPFLSVNERHALLLVINEKRALHHLLSFARSGLEMLHAPSVSSLDTRLIAAASNDPLVFAFLERVIAPLTRNSLQMIEEPRHNSRLSLDSSFSDAPTPSEEERRRGLAQEQQKQVECQSEEEQSVEGQYQEEQQDVKQQQQHQSKQHVLSVEEFREEYDVCVQDWELCEEVLVEIEVSETEDSDDISLVHRLLMDARPPAASRWPRLQ